MNMNNDWLNLADYNVFSEIMNFDDNLALGLPTDLDIPNSLQSQCQEIESNEIFNLLCNDFEDVQEFHNVTELKEKLGDLPAEHNPSVEMLLDNTNNDDVLSKIIQESSVIDDLSPQYVTINLQDLEGLDNEVEILTPSETSVKVSSKNLKRTRKSQEVSEHSTKKRKLDSDKYLEMRKKNNQASIRSRQSRKEHERSMEVKCSDLEKENEILKIKVEKLAELVSELKKKLIDSVVNCKK